MVAFTASEMGCLQFFSAERHMTINIHNLLHIHASVHNLGPLWANSTFDFEDANGELTALFHGTQNIDMQVIKIARINNTVLIKYIFERYLKASLIINLLIDQ